MTIADCMSGKRSGLITFPTDLITPPGISVVRPGAGSPYPPDLPGLKLWLDFSDLATLFVDSAGTIPVVNNGDLIGHAKDKSGNGNNAIQATTASKFTWKYPGWNALGVGTADGTADWLAVADAPGLDGGAGLTIIIVVKQRVLADNNILIAKWTYQTDGAWAIQTTDPTNKDELITYVAATADDGGSNRTSTTNANLTADFHILSIVYDGTQAAGSRIKYWKNGNALSTSTSGTIPTSMRDSGATLNIAKWGGSLTRYYDGDFAEVIIYNSALSTANQALVESYLNGKWTVY